nr:hypothetical protein [Thioalkalivibrio sp.]
MVVSPGILRCSSVIRRAEERSVIRRRAFPRPGRSGQPGCRSADDGLRPFPPYVSRVRARGALLLAGLAVGVEDRAGLGGR